MSASQQLSSTIPVFDGSNYMVWVREMESYLMANGLWSIVSGLNLGPAIPDAEQGGATNPEYLNRLQDFCDRKD